MPRPVAARAAQRGFPVFDFAGQTGQGRLPDSTAPPAKAGLPAAPWTDPNTDLGSVPAVLPPPEEYVLGLSLWGLPAAANPDDTPRTHAAPLADPALLAAGEGTDLHAGLFTGAAEPEFPPYAASFDGPTASVRAQDVVGADVPDQGPPAGQSPVPAYAASFWG